MEQSDHVAGLILGADLRLHIDGHIEKLLGMVVCHKFRWSDTVRCLEDLDHGVAWKHILQIIYRSALWESCPS